MNKIFKVPSFIIIVLIFISIFITPALKAQSWSEAKTDYLIPSDNLINNTGPYSYCYGSDWSNLPNGYDLNYQKHGLSIIQLPENNTYDYPWWNKTLYPEHNVSINGNNIPNQGGYIIPLMDISSAYGSDTTPQLVITIVSSVTKDTIVYTYPIKNVPRTMENVTKKIKIDIIGANNQTSEGNNNINIHIYDLDFEIPIEILPDSMLSPIDSNFAYNNFDITQFYISHQSLSPIGQFIYIHPYNLSYNTHGLKTTCPTFSHLSVNIQNINIQILDPEPKADTVSTDTLHPLPLGTNYGKYNLSPSITILGCDTANVRNCYFSSFFNTQARYLLEIYGCSYALIDKVEIAAFNGYPNITQLTRYGCKGCGGGGGIRINNEEKSSKITKPHKTLNWYVIQNCYIHDYKPSSNIYSYINIDGITTNNPENGIIFNCYYKKWVGADVLDWSYRDTCSDFAVSRVERCVFDHCNWAKSTGEVKQTNYPTVFWTNNIYYNTPIEDYHIGSTSVYHVNETMYFDDVYSTFCNFYGQGIDNLGYLYFFNNIFYYNYKLIKNTGAAYKTANDALDCDLSYIMSDFNAYCNFSTEDTNPFYRNTSGAVNGIKKGTYLNWLSYHKDTLGTPDLRTILFDKTLFDDLDAENYHFSNEWANDSQISNLQDGTDKFLNINSFPKKPVNYTYGTPCNKTIYYDINIREGMLVNHDFYKAPRYFNPTMGAIQYDKVCNASSSTTGQINTIQNSDTLTKITSINTNVIIPTGVTLTVKNKLFIPNEKNMSIIIENGGTLVMDNGAIITNICDGDNYWDGTIIVKPGGNLILNGESELRLKSEGKIIVEADDSGYGTMIFNQGANILLKDADTKIDISGMLEIGQNADFKFNGDGYVKFSQNILSTLKNHIIAGIGSSITFDGQGKNKKMLEVDGGYFGFTLQLNNISKVSFKDCGIEFGNNCILSINQSYSFNHVKFTSTINSNKKWGGIYLNGQAGDITNCSFSNAIVGIHYGPDIKNKMGNYLLKVTNSSFTDCNTGIATIKTGANLYMVNFINCGMGWNTTEMSYPSTYKYGTIKNTANVKCDFGIYNRSKNVELQVFNVKITGINTGIYQENGKLTSKCCNIYSNNTGIEALKCVLNLSPTASTSTANSTSGGQNLIRNNLSANLQLNNVNLLLDNGHNDLSNDDGKGLIINCNIDKLLSFPLNNKVYFNNNMWSDNNPDSHPDASPINNKIKFYYVYPHNYKGRVTVYDYSPLQQQPDCSQITPISPIASLCTQCPIINTTSFSNVPLNQAIIQAEAAIEPDIKSLANQNIINNCYELYIVQGNNDTTQFNTCVINSSPDYDSIISDNIENSRNNAIAIDMFKQILTSGFNDDDSLVKSMKDFAIQRIHFATASITANQDVEPIDSSSYQLAINNVLSVHKNLDVLKILTDTATGDTIWNNYKEKFQLEMSKAAIYRLENRYDLALQYMDSIGNCYLGEEEFRQLNDFKKLVKAENLVMTGEVPKEKFDSIYTVEAIMPGIIDTTAQIDTTAIIGYGSSIGENTIIGVNVKIGKNVQIGSGCWLQDSTVVCDNAKLADNVIISKHTVIDKGAEIGIRLGTAPQEPPQILGSQKIRGGIKPNYTISEYTTIIGKYSKIGEYTRVGALVYILDSCNIGRKAVIRDSVVVYEKTNIGNFASLSDSSVVYSHAVIGDGSYIGKYTHIHYGARIGLNVIIRDSVTIDSNARIADKMIINKNAVVPDTSTATPGSPFITQYSHAFIMFNAKMKSNFLDGFDAKTIPQQKDSSVLDLTSNYRQGFVVNKNIQFKADRVSQNYLWDFGDCTTSNDENPVHKYTKAGIYFINLKDSTSNCSSSSTHYLGAITVYPELKTGITKINTPCSLLINHVLSKNQTLPDLAAASCFTNDTSYSQSDTALFRVKYSWYFDKVPLSYSNFSNEEIPLEQRDEFFTITQLKEDADSNITFKYDSTGNYPVKLISILQNKDPLTDAWLNTLSYNERIDTIIANTPPQITLQPGNTTTCRGIDTVFRLHCTGNNLNYLWYKNDTTLMENGEWRMENENNSKFKIINSQLSDAGTYKCVITNTCGSVTSDTVLLTVNLPPEITQQPVSLKKCLGNNAAFEITATGTAPLTYQWLKNDTTLSGATNSSFTIQNSQFSNEGAYKCIVSNSCATVTSYEATLHIESVAAVITMTPSNSTQCTDNYFEFNAKATGSSPIIFNWYKNDTINQFNNDSIYSFYELSLQDSGHYKIIASNACGSDTSSVFSLTVNKTPEITKQPTDTNICAGSNAEFKVTLESDTTLTYQWYKIVNSEELIVNSATNSQFSIFNSQLSDAGIYNCIISNTHCSITSEPATLYISGNSPVITLQPHDSSQCIGSDFLFKINATTTGNEALNFQWYQNDSIIPYAIDSLYYIYYVDSASTGNYKCVVSNTCGAVTSNVAAFTVNTPLIITQQPVGDTLCQGSNLSVSMKISGSAPYTYQLFKDEVALNEITYIDTRCADMDNLYAAEATYQAESGNYADLNVLLNNNNITNIPTGFTATPFNSNNPPYAIIAATAASKPNMIRVAGYSVTYIANNTGIAVPSGISFDNNEPVTPDNYTVMNDCPVYPLYTNITDTTFTLNNITQEYAGTYKCVISNACGSVTTDDVILTVLPSIAITTQPVGDTLCAGENFSASLSITGVAPFTYQIFKNDTALNEIISYDSRCAEMRYVFNAVETYNSEEGVYPENLNTLLNNNYITYIPQGFTATTFNNNNPPYVIIAATAANKPNMIGIPAYYITYIANNTEVAIPSSIIFDNSEPITPEGYTIMNECPQHFIFTYTTDTTFIINNIRIEDAGTYKCVISDACGSVTTDDVTIIVNTTPVINLQPESDSKCIGETMTFTIEATGAEPLNYQWQIFEENITGATNSSYFISSVSYSNEGYYRCIITNSCGSLTSDRTLLLALKKPSIGIEPVSYGLGCGDSLRLSLTPEGTSPFEYQWKKDNTNIEGATRYVYRIGSILNEDEGSYSCLISNSCGSTTPAIGTLTVGSGIEIIQLPESDTKCEGEEMTFGVEAESLVTLSYQWQKDEEDIEDATASNYVINTTTTDDAGDYRCVITNECGSITIDAVTLVVNQIQTTALYFAGTGAGDSPVTWSGEFTDETEFEYYYLFGEYTSAANMASQFVYIINNANPQLFTAVNCGSGIVYIRPVVLCRTYTESLSGCCSSLTSNPSPAPCSLSSRLISNSNKEIIVTTVDLYPNPNDGSFNIDVALPVDENVIIDSYSILGEKVLSEIHSLKAGFNKLNLKIINPASGIYFVLLKTNNEVFNKKIIVK